MSATAAAPQASSVFTPALLIVDFQEDFCPPSGALAVTGGRDIAPIINKLLSFPGFAVRVATKDSHPRDHISFASNHAPPDNSPYISTVGIANPRNSQEVLQSLLWPDHCIQGTEGAELVPELETSKIDFIVEKGRDPMVEMYSAFRAPFSNPRVADTGLAEYLRGKGVTHVFCVGLAFDYCVKCTAIDAAKEGFETFIIDEAAKPVDGSKEARDSVVRELQKHGVEIVSMRGEQVQRVRDTV